jgi:GDP-L-fucose synthase
MRGGQEPFSLRHQKIFVAGQTGMGGAALVRRLAREGCEILTATRGAADLRRQEEVERLLDRLRPDAVVIAAARVGIKANNDFPVDFLAEISPFRPIC